MAKVVSLGVHIVDVLGRPVAGIPPGQNLAILDEIRMTVAGTAAGASVDMAKLGLEVIAMGAIGNDEIGEFLLGVMQRYGVDTTHLKRKAGAQTSSTMLPIPTDKGTDKGKERTKGTDKGVSPIKYILTL